MNIHEYQAKAILREFGVPVPDGHVCYNRASAREWAKRLGEGPWVVKAQIHAGGRGKGGGVKLARTADEVRNIARDMLGMTLRTHQTGPEGKVVTRVLVENGCNIARELYVSLLVDRAPRRSPSWPQPKGGWISKRLPPQPRKKSLQKRSIHWSGLPLSSAAKSPSAWALPAN